MIVKSLLWMWVLGGAQGAVSEPFQVWDRIRQPLEGEAAAIGTPSAGCLAGAERLPLDGPGFSVMRPSRERYYGHPSLVGFLRNLGQAAQKKRERILVGDLGRARGGPMISGHASHQSGLDVDVWFYLPKRRPSAKERETWGAPSHVTKRGGIKPSWNDRLRWLVREAALAPEVDRIFVHAAIKRDFCKLSPEAPWLAKLRPWWGHDDHLHARLRCPAGDSACSPQEPLPPGNGCGADLEWWFSAEAKAELEKRKAAVAGGRVFPELPEACQKMVAEVR